MRLRDIRVGQKVRFSETLAAGIPTLQRMRGKVLAKEKGRHARLIVQVRFGGLRGYETWCAPRELRPIEEGYPKGGKGR